MFKKYCLFFILITSSVQGWKVVENGVDQHNNQLWKLTFDTHQEEQLMKMQIKAFAQKFAPNPQGHPMDAEDLEEMLLSARLVMTKPLFNRPTQNEDALWQAIAQFPFLKSLAITSYGLTKIPKAIGKLTNLTQLNLSENRIKTISNDIGKLQHLRIIFLNGNKVLKHLPEGFCRLQNLQNLNIAANALEIFPENFGELENLTFLNAGFNKLETLPASFAKLKNLTHLGLSGNSFKTLPENFGALPKLESLDLNHNSISAFPESFAKLDTLKKLQLGKNCLVHVPAEVFALKGLEELDLGKNILKSLPPKIGNLKTLKDLHIGHNKYLTHVPTSILGLAPSKGGLLTSLFILNVPFLEKAAEGFVTKAMIKEAFGKYAYENLFHFIAETWTE